MSGFGAVVHFAPFLKYSLQSERNALYSKNLWGWAMGASIISSPTHMSISRGIALYIPLILRVLKKDKLYTGTCQNLLKGTRRAQKWSRYRIFAFGWKSFPGIPLTWGTYFRTNWVHWTHIHQLQTPVDIMKNLCPFSVYMVLLCSSEVKMV